jgi:predicted Zn-dependent protease
LHSLSRALSRIIVSVSITLSLLLHSAELGHAQGMARGIIRDTEIENLLRVYAGPIFKAAGISKGSIQIVLLGDRSFNAFVTDGRRMFFNIGALMDAKTPNEIIGVIAHESGHIAGGHLVLQRERLASAQIMAIAGILLGAGAMVAGSGQPDSNSGSGGVGVMLGTQELVKRSLLSYQRGEEQAADRAALKYLGATGQSAQGILTTFKRFSDDMMFKTSGIDPYLMSHPMPADRIASLETLVAASPYRNVKDPASLQARHDMMRAKLFGFAGRQDEVGRRYPAGDTTLPAQYARAILSYRYKRLGEALSRIDSLIAAQPGNPYFWELKGQVLLEFGRPKEAIPALRRAISLEPTAGLIRGMLGHALVATDAPGNRAEAINELTNAVQREPDDTGSYRHLATAYARQGNIGMAELNTAQASFTMGDYSAAATHATRALKTLKSGTPAALKAEDILNYRPKRLR